MTTTREQYWNELQSQIKHGQAPKNMTLEAFVTLQRSLYEYGDGYKETVFDHYRRVAATAASFLPMHPGIEKDFFYLISHNILGVATPVGANLGTPSSALPISCYVIDVQDSVQGIFYGLFKAAMLTKCGGGVGVGLGPIRDQGSLIKGGGKSNGAKPWANIYDFASRVVSQAGVRRGQFSFYINIESNDLWDMLLAKDHSKGDPRTHLHSNIAVNISDKFMIRLLEGDPDAIARWNAVLRCRQQSGSPYLHFIDNANRGLVQWMKELGKKVSGSNICTEITSCADELHDMVCCLASANLSTYDNWKHWKGKYGNVQYTGILFLDAVMSAFIDAVESNPEEYRGFEGALRYAKAGRPLGLGVFGQHAYYMKKGWAFKSQNARDFNYQYHRETWRITDEASVDLGDIYGPCEWAKNWGRRNIQTTSIAPTVGNSVTSMGITPGIEPIAGNFYEAKGAAGSWMRRNPILETRLASLGLNTSEIWDRILKDNGSVQGIDEIPDDIKEIFLQFDEIDQKEIIYQASVRQKFLEQTQSVNLAFKEDADADYISDVHIMAYQAGLHTLYYYRTESAHRDTLRNINKKEKTDGTDLIYTSNYVVISRDKCSWCEKAIGLLENNRIEYHHYNEHSEEASKFVDKVPKGWTSYPRIFKFDPSNGDLIFIGGFVELTTEIMGNASTINVQEDCVWCD